MVLLMMSCKLLKHSVIMAIDYWLAIWTSNHSNHTMVPRPNGTCEVIEANRSAVDSEVRFRRLVSIARIVSRSSIDRTIHLDVTLPPGGSV